MVAVAKDALYQRDFGRQLHPFLEQTDQASASHLQVNDYNALYMGLPLKAVRVLPGVQRLDWRTGLYWLLRLKISFRV